MVTRSRLVKPRLATLGLLAALSFSAAGQEPTAPRLNRSGAQVASTDFLKPGGGAARCDPLSAPQGCEAAKEASAATWPDRRYTPLASRSPVQDRNFYLFTAIDALPAARRTLLQSVALQAVIAARAARLDQAMQACTPAPACQVDALLWTDAEIAVVGAEMKQLQSKPPLRALVAAHLRPSGRAIRHAWRSDAELLAAAWTDAAQAMNRVLRVYARAEAPRYPDIDATGLDTQGERFKLLWTEMLSVLRATNEGPALYDLPLRVALTLLHLDERENAAQYPQLDAAENAAAAKRAVTLDWSTYRYSAILVLGDGPTVQGQKVGQEGKLRLLHAVRLYEQGLAPFLIVSGGNVHPARTAMNEAEQMKALLMTRYGIPENAIVMEPHARHTTTNFRNAARLMFRYGFPLEKAALVSTSGPHSQYCESEEFRQRLLNELGAMPMQLGTRLSAFDLEFKPLPMSLHHDALDPLDP